MRISLQGLWKFPCAFQSFTGSFVIKKTGKIKLERGRERPGRGAVG
jgi:hypothetical protein